MRGRNVGLTHREFDTLHILIANHRRIMTFEMISYYVWGYDDEYVLPKTIHNIMSRVKQKLKVEPDVPDEECVCVQSISYSLLCKWFRIAGGSIAVPENYETLYCLWTAIPSRFQPGEILQDLCGKNPPQTENGE